MTAGKPVEIRIEWEPNAGYIALVHNDPLPAADRHSLWLSLGGRQGDRLLFRRRRRAWTASIAGYRALTGKAAMMPQWAYGFWQSRQRYETQDQLLGVRRANIASASIPLDNIVAGLVLLARGSVGQPRCSIPARFPDPKAMVDEVHALNAQIMISVWPKFYPTTDNGKELDAKGCLYHAPARSRAEGLGRPGLCQHLSTIPISEGRARHLFPPDRATSWSSKGFDAWWMDATEPDMAFEPVDRGARISDGADRASGRARRCSTPIRWSMPRAWPRICARRSRTRAPFILTRSGFGGHPARRARRCGRATSPRAGTICATRSRRASTCRCRASPTGRTTSAASRSRIATPSQEPGATAPNGANSTCAGSSSARSRPLFRSHGEIPHREIYEIAPDDPAMYDVDGLVRPAALPADALYLHHSPPTPITRTARSCAGW